MRNLLSTLKKNNGFTLIEILIAVLILGIVSTIAIVGVTGALNNSKKTACKTDVRSLDNAMQAYYNDNPGTNPTSDSGGAGQQNIYNDPAVTFATGDLVSLKYFAAFDPNTNYRISLTTQLSGTTSQYTVTVKRPSGATVGSYTKDQNGNFVPAGYVDPCAGL